MDGGYLASFEKERNFSHRTGLVPSAHPQRMSNKGNGPPSVIVVIEGVTGQSVHVFQCAVNLFVFLHCDKACPSRLLESYQAALAKYSVCGMWTSPPPQK